MVSWLSGMKKGSNMVDSKSDILKWEFFIQIGQTYNRNMLELALTKGFRFPWAGFIE